MQNLFGTILKVTFTAAILAVLFWRLDLRSVMETLAMVSPLAIVGAVLVVIFQMAIAAQRLSLVLVRYRVAFPFGVSFRTTLECMFFSQTFLSFLGGDVLRIWRVRRHGLTLTDATTAVFLDRMIGILVNHVFLLLSLPWLLAMIGDEPVRVALISLAIGGVAGFLLMLLIARLRGRGGYLHRLRARIPDRRVTLLLIELSSVGRHFLTGFPQLAGIVLVSSFIAAANIVIFAIILIGMGVDPPLALGCSLLVPAVWEITLIPLSIGGWGLREGAAVVAFGALGLPMNQALASSVAFGLIFAAVSLLGGVAWLTDRRDFATSLKREAAPERGAV